MRKKKEKITTTTANCTGIFLTFIISILAAIRMNITLIVLFRMHMKKLTNETTATKNPFAILFFQRALTVQLVMEKRIRTNVHTKVSVSFSHFLLSLQVEKQSKLSVLKNVSKNCIINFEATRKRRSKTKTLILRVI